MANSPLNNRRAAFTLVEVLVAIAVLALLVVLMAQLFNNATTASALSNTHIEADTRVRLLFARMAADFSHIVKRTDVDYLLKPEVNSASPTSQNDQMAFFSEVSGYSTVPDAQNSVSVVAYRLNTTGTMPCIERLGTAVSWGIGSTGISPMVFEPQLIQQSWPTATMIPASSATSDAAYDPNYETIVPNAFRFEYYYQLHSGALSATPYDSSVTVPQVTPNDGLINGLQDVSGIGVVVAVADRKAGAIATSSQLQTLGSNMKKFTTGLKMGQLQTAWQATVTSSGLPAPIEDGIRIYEEVFCIDTPSQ